MSVPSVSLFRRTSIDGTDGVPVYRVDTTTELVMLYIVWELRTDNMIHIRAITTTEEKARDYLHGFKMSETGKGNIRRLQVEPVYANHLYGESMYAYAAAMRSQKMVAEASAAETVSACSEG